MLVARETGLLTAVSIAIRLVKYLSVPRSNRHYCLRNNNNNSWTTRHPANMVMLVARETGLLTAVSIATLPTLFGRGCLTASMDTCAKIKVTPSTAKCLTTSATPGGPVEA